MGLQNPVHECESRTRLHVTRAGAGTGIQSGLKIRALWREGSIPSPPTKPLNSGII